MKEIPLTQGYFALVDDEDYDMLMKYKWCAGKYRSGIVYAQTQMPIPPDPKRKRNRKSVLMHRFIMGVNETKIQVDHKDQNGLNNTKENLRLCSHAENQRNSGPQKNNKTGYKGVCFRKSKNRFRAEISINSKMVSIGLFKSAEEAAMAYDRAAILNYGKFAWLNFPEKANTGND